MFFKLLMPSVDPLMKGGVVAKWHKAKGDIVGYGDDLVDVQVELTMSVLDRGSMEQRIRLLKDGGAVREEALTGIANKRTLILVARVASSDAGVLRRIEAREGDYVSVGGLLAVLSAGEQEIAHSPDEKLQGASEFRVVANLIG